MYKRRRQGQSSTVRSDPWREGVEIIDTCSKEAGGWATGGGLVTRDWTRESGRMGNGTD